MLRWTSCSDAASAACTWSTCSSSRPTSRAGRWSVAPDPHSGPVSERAWDADRAARARGRVAMFNATRPDGLDGWTMDAAQYALLRDLILDTIDDQAGSDGSVALRTVVEAAQDRYGAHPLSPAGACTTTARSPRSTSRPGARSSACRA